MRLCKMLWYMDDEAVTCYTLKVMSRDDDANEPGAASYAFPDVPTLPGSFRPVIFITTYLQ